jgi:hypothetical protein
VTSPVKKTIKIPVELYDKLAAHGKMNVDKSVDEVAEDALKLGVQTMELVTAAKNAVGKQVWSRF